jgi:hypothetical protein
LWKPSWLRHFEGASELTPSQRIDGVAREDDPLPLPPRQARFRQVIDPASIASRTWAPKPPQPSADSFAGSWRSSQVGPRRRHLRLDRKIGARGERQAAMSIRVVVDRASTMTHRRCIAGHLEIGEPEMMGAPVDTSDDCVGAFLQFVVEVSVD